MLKKFKILTVIGARPQFIKAAALSREFSKHNEIEEIIVHTGQHFDKNMSEIFFEEMNIPIPRYNLAINSLSHGAMTGRMMEEIEKILLIENPDFLIVYGDTNSTLAGALAAKKLHIKVVHIEAGLRSFNNDMPEEINRILTDRLSDYLFCPTQTAVNNLLREGYENIDTKIINSGDVMQDASIYYANESAKKSNIISSLHLDKFILCTIHRAENTDDSDRLKNIIEALNKSHQTIPIVLPLHPRTKQKIESLGINLEVKAIEPVGYFDMIELLKNCSLVITDSGGLQKEAYFFNKNCVILREQTEWVELVENKVSILVGANYNSIIKEIDFMINKSSDFSNNLYGNGTACNKICSEILKINF